MMLLWFRKSYEFLRMTLFACISISVHPFYYRSIGIGCSKKQPLISLIITDNLFEGFCLYYPCLSVTSVAKKSIYSLNNFTISIAGATSCTRKIEAPFVNAIAFKAVVPFKDSSALIPNFL